MARPSLYLTEEARSTARRAQWKAAKLRARNLTTAPVPSAATAIEPHEAPVDAVVSLFDAASRRVARDVFAAQAQTASPAERQMLSRFATALRASFMGEAEVLIARCL